MSSLSLSCVARRPAFCLAWWLAAALTSLSLPASSQPSASAAPSAAAPQRPAAAPRLPAGLTFVREMGGISEYRLPNGLQVLLFPDEAQSTTTVNITYRVGSRHEAPGEYGMAHLLEHLLFKGTPKFRDIPGLFAERGVRFNGTTTADRTNYFASFNADPATLDLTLALEADRMVRSFIAKKDLDTEMTVVRNEFENSENDPERVLSKRLSGVAYDWHNYGHDVLGARSDIENVPIERLQAFYKRFYRPDNATLMVAGRFDPSQVLARIHQQFGPLRRPASPVPSAYTVEPAQDGERSVVVRRVGGQPMLMVHYHVPSTAHPDTPALMMLGLLLSLEPSGQLYRELVETRLALNASFQGTGSVDPGGMTAFAALPPGADVAQVQAKLLEVVERGNPFLASELTRVRDLALTTYREQMKHPEGLIQQLSHHGGQDWRLLFQLMEDLPKVTLDDVERVRKTYLRAANRTVARYEPTGEVDRVEIPAAPPMDQRLAQLQGPPKVEPGESLAPTPQALAPRTSRQRLPSGIELITLDKRTRGRSVHLQMALRWGEREEAFQHRGAGVVAALMRDGSLTVDQQALQDRLLALRADLRIDSTEQGALLRITAEKDTLPQVLALAADVMQHPRFPQDAFDRYKAGAMAEVEASRQTLDTLRQMAVREHYNRARGVGPGHPDYVMSVNERLARMQATTLDDVRAFHQRYWSANMAQVAVAGDLPDGLDQEIERLFGGWKKPSAPAYVRHVPKADVIPAARFDAQATDKPGAEFLMRQDFALNEKDPAALPLAVATHIFGGGGLESRLGTALRQRSGLSYGVGAWLSVPSFGNDADFVIGGTFAPDKRDALLRLVQDELQRMRRDGVTRAEVARAKADLREARRQYLADDSALAGQLLDFLDRGQNWSDIEREDAQLAALTVEPVNAAWRSLIRDDGFVVSTAGDFKPSPGASAARQSKAPDRGTP